MLIIRNTQKVAKELGLTKSDIHEIDDEGYLGSWFCNVVTIKRRKCLIFCHSATLYCFFVPCVTKKTFGNFIQVFYDNLVLNLEYEGFSPVVIRNLLAEYRDVVFAKTNSRSVLGTMNDYCFLFENFIEPEGSADCGPSFVNQKLNTAPMGAIKYSSGITEMKRQLMRVPVNKKPPAEIKTTAPAPHASYLTKENKNKMKLYRFKVSIMGIPKLYRVIEASGNCTFDDLHVAIFKAFNRFDEHLYSFYITGKDTDDIRRIIDSPEITHPQNTEDILGFGKTRKSAAGIRIRDVGLNESDVVHYLFDFGDSWWHRIRVEKIVETDSRKKHIQLIKSVGESPPQYPDFDEDDDEEDE